MESQIPENARQMKLSSVLSLTSAVSLLVEFL